MLSVNRQRIAVMDDAFVLPGCVVSGLSGGGRRFQRLAGAIAAAPPELQGCVGVDLIVGPNSPQVLEVNPRLTRYYVGLKESIGVNPAAWCSISWVAGTRGAGRRGLPRPSTFAWSTQMSPNPCIGWDLGGAHFKVVKLVGPERVCRVVQVRCALLQGLDRLEQGIDRVLALIGDTLARHAVTMTGELPDHADLHARPDGRDPGIAASAQRVARMVGLDAGAADLSAWRHLAGLLAEMQLRAVSDACGRILSRGELSAEAPVVGAGAGCFIVRRLAKRLNRPFVPFAGFSRRCWPRGRASETARRRRPSPASPRTTEG